MMALDGRDRTTILAHYYRAMVGRADMWRTRMDTTTNWAIGATAAVVSFVIGNASVPHYATVIAPLLTLCFLALEARRLTFYQLWQGRVLLIERGMIRPALWSGLDQPPETQPIDEGAFARELDAHLGSTVPTMPILKAAARRLRRIYVYLFAAHEAAWIVKLASHPSQAKTLSEIVERAGTAGIPGPVWLGLSLFSLLAAAVVAAAMGGVDRRS
jgi:uncharacterized membrane protein